MTNQRSIDEGCCQCSGPVVAELDGDGLCQTCLDAWAADPERWQEWARSDEYEELEREMCFGLRFLQN